MASQLIADLFSSDIASGINIYSGGRATADVSPLTPTELQTVAYVFNQGMKLLNKVSPAVAKDIGNQLGTAQKWAGVVKAAISTTGGTKPINYPSTPGSVGVTWCTPEQIRYISTQSSTNSAYTDYPVDSWTIATLAGTPNYILGSGTYTQNTPPTTPPTLSTTNYFMGSQQSQAHSMYCFFQDGLIEIGTTPKFQQFQIYTQTQQAYGIYTVNPVNEQPVETNRAIYQYQTLGFTPVYFDLGITWAAMPIVTGNATVKPLGFCFYEHLFAPTLVYV